MQQVYVGSEEEAFRYVLTDARIEAVLADEDVLPSVTRSVAMLTDKGTSLEDAVSQVAACYSIPPACVEEILAQA